MDTLSEPKVTAPVAVANATQSAANDVAAVTSNTSPTMEQYVAFYDHYIQCTGGVAVREKCPAHTMFYVKHKNCTSYKPRTEGAAKTPPAGCQSLECACKGRKDGLYVNPASPNNGVACSLQEPHPFTCQSGSAAVEGKGCVDNQSPRRLHATSWGN